MISHMIAEEYWSQLELVSSPYPTLEEGKGSGELWPNLQFLHYGVH